MAAKGNITIEGARIIFRDFSGEKNRYNNDRTFTLALDDILAERLKADGWPVRYLEPRNEEETATPILNVKVYFGKVPPQIVMITNGVKKDIDESNVNILDWANFENVDVKIRPFNYDFNGHTGIKAYLKSLWVTVAEDDLEAKYKNYPYANEGEAPAESQDLPLPFTP